MSALDETRTAATTARDAIDAGSNQLAAAINEAQNKGQQFAGLGLTGVVATVQAAQHSLEAAASSLATAHQAADSAVTTLGGITSDTDVEDVAQRLDGVIGQLDQTAAGVDAATGEVGEALTHAQQAKIDSLANVITVVGEAVSAARQSVDSGKDKTQTYRQQVEAAAGASRGN